MRFHQISIRYAQILQELGPGPLGDPWLIRPPTLVARPEWRPPVDVCETARDLVVKVEVAGLSEDDFEILLYEDAIVIRGERPWRSCDPAARFHLAEIRHGTFRLELPIPASVDAERVTAQYRGGFLVVNLPKAA